MSPLLRQITMAMTFLFTGSAGPIGSELCADLARELGCTVTGSGGHSHTVLFSPRGNTGIVLLLVLAGSITSKITSKSTRDPLVAALSRGVKYAG